jgi:membrane protein implicated in regulation of membrane protease activity
VEFKIWMAWMILAAVCIIAEIFTAGFFMFWFGLGATVAMILALLGLPMGLQWGAFIVISGVLFAVSRRLVDRISKAQPPGIGADRTIGKECMVLETIDNVKNTGRVRLGKEEWRADSETRDVIPKGAVVIVVRFDGTHVMVKPVSKGD